MYDKDLHDVLKSMNDTNKHDIDRESIASVSNILISSILGPRIWVGGNFFEYMKIPEPSPESLVETKIVKSHQLNDIKLPQ